MSHVGTRSVAIVVGVLGLLASPVLVTPSASADPLSATVSATPLTASLVRTVATSTLSPPIPDPAGITYIPSRDRLLISDSEVDEVPIYQGSNLFEITRAGVLVRSRVSPRLHRRRPRGVGHNPANGHIFVSDDDQFRVYEVAAGADGRYGTADDTRTFINTAAFGSTDPEDVEFYPPTGELFILDGADHDVHRVSPGPNGVFDGVAPTGDDIAAEFDVQMYGAEDPEGIGFHPGRNTLLIVDSTIRRGVRGEPQRACCSTGIDISASNQLFAAGITVAPATERPEPPGTSTSSTAASTTTRTRTRTTASSTRCPSPCRRSRTSRRWSTSDRDNADPRRRAAGPATPRCATTGSRRPSTTVSWSTVSGPGTVSFSRAERRPDVGDFSASGTYVLRATASDTALTGSDELTVTVVAAGVPLPFNTPVAKAFDDVEQRPTGFADWLGNTLNLPNSGGTTQTVGIRFDNLEVPKGATITEAWIQFTAQVAPIPAQQRCRYRGVAADDTPTSPPRPQP